MIEAKLSVAASRNVRASLFLRNQLSSSFRIERSLEKKSLSLKKKLVEDRNRTLKGLVSRSTEKEKGKKGGVGTLSLLGGGLLGKRLLGRGRVPKIPTRSITPLSRVGRLGKLGPLAVVGTGLDFAGRKAEGQTNLQAGLGAGGGLAGALAGGKYGAILGTAVGGPIGTVVGGIGGSIVGGLAGGRLADIFSGADRRRKFEEQRVEMSTKKTLFSGALDDLDRVLDKLEETSILTIIKKQDDGLPEKERLPGLIPRNPFIGKGTARRVGEELAKYAAIAGVTFLLIPSDPTDIATTAPLAIKLQALAKSTRLFKALKGIFVKPPKFLQPGKDIPGISAKGLKIRAEALLRKLNPNIKFDPKKLTKKQIEAKTLKDLLKQEKVLQEKLKKLTGSKTIDEATQKAIQKFTERLVDITKRLEGKKIPDYTKTKKFAPGGVFTRPGTNINNLKVEASTNDNNFIAQAGELEPPNNIFLINQDNSQKSSPTIIQGGSDNIAMIRGSGTNSFDSLTKYGEMTALMTV